MDARKNFAFGTLASGIASGATSLSVGSGEGARFPAVPFNAVIWQATDYSNPAAAYHAGHAEIVRVTNISSDTLTITRAQESTSAVNLNTGGKSYIISAGPTSLYWDQAYLAGDVLTTRGDITRRGASNPERLALGSRWKTLTSDGTDLVYADDGVWGPFNKARTLIFVPNGGASATGYGMGLTLTGTATAIAPDASNPNWLNLACAATTGSDLGIAPTDVLHFARSIRFVACIKLEENTDIRMWVGLTSAAGTTMSASDNPAGHLAVFRYSTDASDTTWRCVTKDNSTLNSQDSGVAISTNKVILAVEWLSSGTVRFYVNGTLVQTITSNVPGSSVCKPLIYGETRANAAKNLRIGWMYCEEIH